MSTERRGEVTGLNAGAEHSASSSLEELLQKQTTICKQMIGFSTAAAVSLGGLGFSMYKASGIQEGLSEDLSRPSQTELSQAQSIQGTDHKKVTLYENCNNLYNPETCQNLQVVPDDRMKEAERTIAQDEAFMNEAGQRKDK